MPPLVPLLPLRASPCLSAARPPLLLLAVLLLGLCVVVALTYLASRVRVPGASVVVCALALQVVDARPRKWLRSVDA